MWLRGNNHEPNRQPGSVLPPQSSWIARESYFALSTPLQVIWTLWLYHEFLCLPEASKLPKTC